MYPLNFLYMYIYIYIYKYIYNKKISHVDMFIESHLPLKQTVQGKPNEAAGRRVDGLVLHHERDLFTETGCEDPGEIHISGF